MQTASEFGPGSMFCLAGVATLSSKLGAPEAGAMGTGVGPVKLTYLALGKGDSEDGVRSLPLFPNFDSSFNDGASRCHRDEGLLRCPGTFGGGLRGIGDFGAVGPRCTRNAAPGNNTNPHKQGGNRSASPEARCPPLGGR